MRLDYQNPFLYNECVISQNIYGVKKLIKQFIKDIFTSAKKEKKSFTKQEQKSKIIFFVLAFIIPFVVVLFAAKCRQLDPFGENNLMAIDAWGQYFPMLREMKRAFRSFDMSYSFSGALGFDLTAQSAYYTNSPLWYLLFLLPGELTPAQVDMMVFIRFAFAAFTFTYFLSEHFGKQRKSMIVFSMAYAFSGYTLAFINQLMWMDAVILLPLVLLGIEKLYKGKGVMLYAVSLLLTIYTNFYIAYAVCIFSVLWFFLVAITEWNGIRDWFIKAFRFGICSLTAGILNIGTLIPLLKAVGNTLASNMGFNKELTFYHSMKEMLSMLLPYRDSSLAFEAPNIYFGIIPAIICIFALLSNASIRKKICYSLLAVFMFISLNFTLLDYIWHGFHFPNQLPGRQSFLFIFLMLVISYNGFETLIYKWIKFRKLRQAAALILCILIGFEITTNTVIKFVDDVRCVPKGSILWNTEPLEIVTDNYSPDYDKNEFWRTELKNHRYNAGQLYGFNGISHYSSTMSGDCYNFFVSLGMSIYAQNVSIEYHPNPVLNSLFGIKYVVSDTGTSDEMSTLAGTAGNMFVHENKEVLPLFYVVNENVLNVDMTLKGHALTNDIFCKAAGTSDVIAGNGIFNEDNVEGYILNCDEFMQGIDNILANPTEINDFRNTKIKGTATCEKDGVLMISLPAKDVTIKIDGEKTEVLTIAGYMAGAKISEGTHTIEILLP